MMSSIDGKDVTAFDGLWMSFLQPLSRGYSEHLVYQSHHILSSPPYVPPGRAWYFRGCLGDQSIHGLQRHQAKPYTHHHTARLSRLQKTSRGYKVHVSMRRVGVDIRLTIDIAQIRPSEWTMNLNPRPASTSSPPNPTLCGLRIVIAPYEFILGLFLQSASWLVNVSDLHMSKCWNCIPTEKSEISSPPGLLDHV